MDSLIHFFAIIHEALFESLVLPLIERLDLLAYAEDAFDFTEWFLIGVLEVSLIAMVILPLEKKFPAERQGVAQAGDQIRIDFTYTLLHRLGAFAVFAFAVLQPLTIELRSLWLDWGLPGVELDRFLGVTYTPLLAALIYLLILDFVDYWIHRGQHRWNWWWSLHALHHSQRQMTVWTDNRNHLIDDLLRDAILAFVALMIGVAPAQFLSFVVIQRVWQSITHANLGIAFPAPLARFVVSPGFHRLHHARGLGHEGIHKGVNFAVLFSVWDWIFRTADWSADRRLARGEALEPTGISDQLQGVSYGRGFWEQQWLGAKRMFASIFSFGKTNP